ncbi:MAG: MlaD family protein [Melioribacteraceae bacterium]|nr:MlaD family protein [Melioribacteraceae bacterium]
MKKEKKTELKVGITVIVGIIVLLWVLGWAKNFSFSSDEKNLTIAFKNVAGLSIGDIVAIQGIKGGYVEDIYNKKNSVIVEVLLPPNYDLREDAKFSIMMLDLMGGKKIEITPGESATPLDYSKVQNGIFLGDVSTTMAMLGSVQNDLVDVIYEIKDALNSFNKLMNHSEFIDELQISVASLNQLIAKTDKIISENGDSFSELLQNSNELVTNSNKFIVKNSANIEASIGSINEVLKSTDGLVLKLNNFFDEVNNQENNLGKLMYDKELVKDLSVTLKQLKELSEIINRQIKEKGLKVDANIF